MSLGQKTRGPRVKTALKVKMFFAVLAAMAKNGPALVKQNVTTLALYKKALQDATNAAARAEKQPRPITKIDETGATVPAFPINDSDAKQSIVLLLEKYAADKRHIDGAQNVDMWGNVKVLSEGEGDALRHYYWEKDGKGGLVKTPVAEDAPAATFPKEITDETISGFKPGERVKQNIDDMFSEASAAEFDVDDLLADYDLTA